MKKRIQLVSKGQKKALCYSALIVLTESQAEKLSCERLIKQIDNMAIDMAIEWAVEISGNYEVLAVSRTTFSPVEEEMLKDIEKTANEFISAIDKLEIPKTDSPEPECPSHESDKIEEVEFVEKLLNDINLPLDDGRHVVGALIIDTTTHPFCPELTGWGKLSHGLLKEMCELYLKEHEPQIVYP